MLKKTLWISFALLHSCALKPPDIPICVEKTPDRGGCVQIISGKEYELNETTKYKIMVDGKEQMLTWWELRPYMVYMPYPAWVELKAWIIKVCKKHEKTCQTEVSSWDRSVQVIDDQLNEKLP